MDNVDLYGRVVTNLFFLKAVSIGCIARPKIIVQGGAIK